MFSFSALQLNPSPWIKSFPTYEEGSPCDADMLPCSSVLMRGGDALLILLAAIQSLSLTCGLLLDSLGESVRPFELRGLVGRPASPFKTALEELVRIGTVAGSIESRLEVKPGVIFGTSELAERCPIPSSMKRLFRGPSGSWPGVVERGRVEAEAGWCGVATGAS